MDNSQRTTRFLRPTERVRSAERRMVLHRSPALPRGAAAVDGPTLFELELGPAPSICDHVKHRGSRGKIDNRASSYYNPISRMCVGSMQSVLVYVQGICKLHSRLNASVACVSDDGINSEARPFYKQDKPLIADV
jgi:hypothetical protein